MIRSTGLIRTNPLKIGMEDEQFSEDLDNVCSGCGDEVNGLVGERYCLACQNQQEEEEQFDRDFAEAVKNS